MKTPVLTMVSVKALRPQWLPKALAEVCPDVMTHTAICLVRGVRDRALDTMRG